MAELKDPQEPTFPSKRKPDDSKPLDTQDPPNKALKPATLDDDDDNNNNNNSNSDNDNEPNSKNHTDCSEPGNDGNELQNDIVDDKVEEEEGGDGEEEDDDDEESNGEAEVDPKGKGVLRDDKGKGKLIEEEEEEDDDDDDDSDDSDDDDDSDEDGNVSGADSDFSDDPLAEVDLNNILPSRTRRRTVHPGLHIASDACNVAANDDDDDDDDDDSDA